MSSVLLSSSRLDQERNDRFALLRVLLGEFAFVRAMFLLRPDGHLHGAGDGEQHCAQRLRHQGESDPRAHLVSVVRARDQIEQFAERVAVRVRNATLRAARWTKVAEEQMNGQVTQFIELENRPR